MKKLTVLALALLLLFSFAACGGEKDDETVAIKTGSDVTGQQSTEASSESETTKGSQDNGSEATGPVFSFSEFTAVDNEEYSITVTDYKQGSNKIKLRIENKSESEYYRFSVETVSLNGVEVYTFLDETLKCGKEENCTLEFEDELIVEKGITDYTKIEFDVLVEDSRDFLADPIATERVCVYPYGEEFAEEYTRESLSADIVLVDNDEIKMTVIGWQEDEYAENIIFDLYLENKSDSVNYLYAIENCAVNGIEISSFDYYQLSAGRVGFVQFELECSELEKIGISDYTDISFGIEAYDPDSWESDYVAQERVSIYPQGIDKAFKYVRESKETDVIVVDNEYVTVTAVALNSDEYYLGLELFYESKSEKNVVYEVVSAEINGIVIDPFYTDSVGGGNCKLSQIEWYTEDLQANEITEIEEIKIIFRAYDSETYNSYFSETFVYNPVK